VRRALLLALLLAIAGALLGSSAGAGSSQGAPRKTHTPAWSLPGKGGFAFGFGSAWIAGGGEMLRINPSTNRVTARIANAGSWPIARPDGIWTIESSALDRIDPAQNKVVTRIKIPSTGSLAYGFGSFWVAAVDGSVRRIDPVAETIVATIPVQDAANWSPQITTGDGAVWVASADKNEIVKIDPTTNTVASTTPIGHVDSLLTVGDAFGSVWAHQNAAKQGRGLLYRIDPTTGTVLSTLTTSSKPGGQYGGTQIVSGAGSVWVGNANGTVSRIAADGSRVIRSVETPILTEFIALGDRSLWVQDDHGNTLRLPLTKFTS
jgi:streptogramin lyase